MVIAWSQAKPGGSSCPSSAPGAGGMLEPPEGTLEQCLDGEVELCRAVISAGRGTGLAVPGDALCHLLSPGRVTGPALGWPRGRLSGQGWTLSSFCQSFVKLPPCSSRRFFSSAGWEGCVGSEAAPEIILRVQGASGAAGRLLSPCPRLLTAATTSLGSGEQLLFVCPPIFLLLLPSFPLFLFPLLHFPPR